MVISAVGKGLSRPELRFTEDDSGRMTGLTISFREEEDIFFLVPTTIRTVATLAFVQAQPGVSLFDTDEVNRILDKINGNQDGRPDPLESSFTDSANGVDIRCRSSCKGYYDTGSGYMIPGQDQERLFTMDYTMTLAD